MANTHKPIAAENRAVHYRPIRTGENDFSDEDTVQVAFASEQPCVMRIGPEEQALGIGIRGDKYLEILSHDRKHVDLDRLNNRGAFLDEHKDGRHLGYVRRAELSKDKISRAVLVFDKATKLSQSRRKQVRSGSRPHMSVGYEHTAYLGRRALPDGKTAHVFAWSPNEVSSVACPADITVGKGRSGECHCIRCGDLYAREMLNEEYICEDCDNAETPAVTGRSQQREIRSQGFMNTTENRDAAEISALKDEFVKDYPHLEDEIKRFSTQALCEDMGRADYKRGMNELIQKAPAPRNNRKAVFPGEIGMNRRELNEYSLLRALQNATQNGGKLKDCYEADVARQCEISSKQDAEGFYIPMDVLTRREVRSYGQRDNVAAGAWGDGGALVPTLVVPSTIDLLRNKSVVLRAGARFIGGLTGSVALPKQMTANQAQSVGEIDKLNTTNLTVDQIKCTPHRVGATTQWSKQLVFQSSPDIENVIYNDFMKIIALKQDYLAINGSGENNEPLGLMSQDEVGQVTFGGAATWANVVAFETALGNANVIDSDDATNFAYVTSPAVRGKWKTIAINLSGATTVSSTRLWQKGSRPGEGIVNDYPALASNQIPLSKVILGAWSELCCLQWGGLDTVLDPYTAARNAELILTVNFWMDVALRHGQSFCISTDAGNL